ncbi:unnamed protein product [Mytilus coruscus]|uniref:Uncharacterized protein n=1 Tax=Mytilus coruscus TaxID=42192 RepID=A0A6J8CTT9_MYTCO|nr:unnamed protein product [Mytilus coruscus]
MSTKTSTPNQNTNPSRPESLSNNRSRSTSRKRQLSKASDEEMKPPASRPRSQSKTRKTDDSDQVIFKTHGQSYNMENLIESTLLKQNVLQNIIANIVKETTQELKSNLQSLIRSAVAEAVSDAVIPLKLRIDEQDQKLITLFDRTKTLKTENEVLMKKIGEKESKIVSY